MTTQHNEALKDQARAQARAILSQSQAFHNLDQNGQMALYRDTVNEQYNQLANKPVLSQAKSISTPNRFAGAFGLPGKETAQEASAFMDGIDFPQFVEDLLNGVFDATLNMTEKQMQSYMALLKEATQDTAYFLKQIDDSEAIEHLVQNNDGYGLDYDDNDKEVVTDEDGNPIDLGDNQLKDKILQAKQQLATEKMRMLQQMVMMGVSRIVVDKGTVKAAVVFDVKASSQSDRQTTDTNQKDSTRDSNYTENRKHRKWNSQWNDKRTQKKTQITVSTAKDSASSELAAKITGEVEINFKSDYFKLDNFKDMYPTSGGNALPQGK